MSSWSTSGSSDTRRRGGAGWKRRAERSTSGSIATPRSWKVTSTGAAMIRSARSRASSAAASDTGGGSAPTDARMTPWGSCSMRRRRATGSTPNPARPFRTVMSSAPTRRRAGTAGVSNRGRDMADEGLHLARVQAEREGHLPRAGQAQAGEHAPGVGARLEGLLHGPLHPRPRPERGARGADAGRGVVGPLDHDGERHELPGAVAHRLLDLRRRQAAHVHARHAHLVRCVAVPVVDGQRRAHAHDQEQRAHGQQDQAQPRVEPPPPPAARRGPAGRWPGGAASCGLTAARDLAHSARL